MTPRETYIEREQRARHQALGSERVERRIALARLLVFGAAALLCWLAFGPGTVGKVSILAPLAGFGVLVALHDRTIRRRRRAERAVALYARGLARLDGRWAGAGSPGERFADPHHPYAADLDLFGAGSLFELLCTARTRMGESALASWLLAPAEAATVRARQEAVRELGPRLDLREDLAMLGEDLRAGVDPEALAAWSTAARQLPAGGARVAVTALPVFTMGALLSWWLGAVGPWPFLAACAVQGVLAAVLKRRVRHVVASVERPGRDLALLAEVLDRFERERFDREMLAGLRTRLETRGVTPSKAVASLARRVDLLNARHNQLFIPVGLLTMWTTQWAFALEGWRAAAGRSVPGWLDAVGELEALGSLAGYAWEHPDDVWPVVGVGEARFEGEALRHPLLLEDRCVPNDVVLGASARLLMVSGSNMSGKSTLLRTVGVNAVLALAGGPARARALRLSELAIGATLRVQDSLQEGTSRFYAEITRLRALVEIAQGARPLLFLLDEILHGTNSHDRRLGAEAVVRGLVSRRAIGLVTTHDLALARIADELGVPAANVHFEDRLEDGHLHFDYRLRPGVVHGSNALALMRAIGLLGPDESGPGLT